MKPSVFFALLGPFATKSDKDTGVPASVTLAQAALESGWGESGLARDGKNLFGVKADNAWAGPTLILPTREYLNGRWVTVNARWRRYLSWEDSFVDHAEFFKRNRRYKRALMVTEDARAFARAIHAAGYATDPNYSNLLIGIMDRHNLYRFDARPMPKQPQTETLVEYDSVTNKPTGRVLTRIVGTNKVYLKKG